MRTGRTARYLCPLARDGTDSRYRQSPISSSSVISRYAFHGMISCSSAPPGRRPRRIAVKKSPSLQLDSPAGVMLAAGGTPGAPSGPPDSRDP